MWKSKDRTRFIHGYSLSIKMVFEVLSLDDTSRGLDLEHMDELEKWLKDTFSYTTCVAEDDPRLADFQRLHSQGVLDLRIMPGVGQEKFAEAVWHRTRGWLKEKGLDSRVSIRTVEVLENQSSSGLYLD
jgi:6-pyruvoyltetrahydropterin/6-carboxytetrahydropterin synthase